jgi:hypothetical protein
MHPIEIIAIILIIAGLLESKKETPMQIEKREFEEEYAKQHEFWR